jgi:hypothetical protein
MTILQRPIYLHLFDRELWESVGQKPNRSSIDRALKSLIVGSSAPLYCGLSLVWENPALRSANNQIDPIILKLIELGVIEPISQYPTVEEFIHTRRDVYKHDQSRYPLYFDSSAGIGPPQRTSSRRVRPNIYLRFCTTGRNQATNSSHLNPTWFCHCVGLSDRHWIRGTIEL